ncbi:MAG: proton-conducting transporter membrane subunit [Pseudomonadota bacterium]
MLDSSFWAICLVVVPLLGAIACFLRPSSGILTGIAVSFVNGGAVFFLIRDFLRNGPGYYPLGGWQPPVGISFRMDGLSLLMIAMTVVTGCGISLYAGGYFSLRVDIARDSRRHEHRESFFWPLWLLLWAGLNGLFLSADFFNIYVTLEIVGLSAAILTALSGKPAARIAAMRYLLVGLLGSCSFLLGVAFLYRTYGVLDVVTVGRMATPSPLLWVALALLTTGLMLKSALFPMHFWLPPAHANALAPVSAILSGLVIKASLYLILRFWCDIFAHLLPFSAYVIMGTLGGGAVIWGAVQALLQKRLKMLVAYSTVAQIGYVLIAFPLIHLDNTMSAWQAAVFLVISHACAKSAMFLAAGAVFLHAGHDRIDDLGGIKEDLPTTAFACAVAGLSLIGLPPSGGFVGKWLLLTVSLRSGHWWWGIMLVAGSLLSAAYIYRVVCPLLTFRSPFPYKKQDVPWIMEWSALFLAVLAMVMGLFAVYPLGLLETGGSFSAAAGVAP